MTLSALEPPAYTDLQGLNALRQAARAQSPQATRAVAQQFEAFFVQLVLKGMRDGALASGMFDTQQSRMYQDLLDKQLAVELSSRGQLGLAEIIAKQLDAMPGHGEGPASKVAPAPSTSPPLNRPAGSETQAAQAARKPPAPSEMDPFSMREDPSLRASGRGHGGSTPAAFIDAVRPYAEEAARTLGVEPEVLIAQAALETGWGQKVLQRADGTSTYNLFGIKAGANWKGERVDVASLEYEGGVARRGISAFRAYSSYRESFGDYADFIRSNPRYGEALKRASESTAYVRALQGAGYATDPQYARKVLDVLHRNVSPELKIAGKEPLP